MARKPLDRQAGALPVIRSDRDSVVFHIQISGARGVRGLVIRCDDAGNVWASLESTGEPRRRSSGQDTRTCR